jgi:hypothetical protein
MGGYPLIKVEGLCLFYIKFRKNSAGMEPGAGVLSKAIPFLTGSG